jgi:hypothetical protein
LEVSVNEDERIVRGAWKEEFIYISFGAVFLCVGQCGVSLPSIRAAAEFTIQHQKKIDDVKEEIEELKARVDGCNETLPRLLTDLMKKETMRKLRIWKRILAARQAALAELQRGMKETE